MPIISQRRFRRRVPEENDMAKREQDKYDYAKEDFAKGRIVIALIGNDRRIVRDIQTRP